MLKALGRKSAVLPLALLFCAGALAQSAPRSFSAASFSADIVSLDTGGAPLGAPARLHVAVHKVRIEMAGASADFFISDGDAGTALLVRSAQRIYMDSRQSTPLTQIFVAVDPHDPCEQWRAAAATAGVAGAGAWRCELIERTTLDRREIIKYRVTAPNRQSSFGWIDAAMAFPVKWQAADGKIFVLENILLQAQPANLFDIPSGYRKFDPQALLERIKRSDVWVDTPK